MVLVCCVFLSAVLDWATLKIIGAKIVNDVIYNTEAKDDVEPQQTSDSPPPSPEPVQSNKHEAEPQPEPEPEPQSTNSETNQTEPITQQPRKTEDGQSTNTGKDPEKVEEKKIVQ